MWLHAPNISHVHGFSTRHGGVSPAPYSTLNLGGSDDDPRHITENRRRSLAALGLGNTTLHTLKQVHGDRVCEASAPRQEGDALVSNRPGSVIAVMVADCYPVLFSDQEAGVIGAAHCGWRGTLAHIAANTVAAMRKLGATPANIRAAIGPGISQSNFEVGQDVIDLFSQAGFPSTAWKRRQLDLVQCILFTLTSAGIPPEHIWSMNRCTFEDDFFSHRRDQGRTGRMMGLIGLRG
jgi:YfiH family protein